MACTECDRLQSEYEHLKRAYDSAINFLTEISDSAPLAEYTKRKTAADDARIECEIGRLELQKHKLIHAHAN